MKRKNILLFLLLFAMSFNTLHAYVLELVDIHPCEVSEYVLEFDKPVHDENNHDICDIHHGFHLVFLMPFTTLMLHNTTASLHPLYSQQEHSYRYNPDFLRPPII